MCFEGFFEKVNHLQRQNIPFVVFSFQNQHKIYLIHQKDDEICKDFEKKQGFLFAPFIGEPILIKKDFIFEFSFEDFFHFEEKKTKSNKKLSDFLSEKDKNQYISLVEKAISEINETKLEKVVVSKNISFEIEQEMLSTYFFRLKKKYPSAFCYVFFHPKVGKWAAATPETLLKIEQNKLFTMALAGTKSALNKEIPNWTEKEFQEHNFVIDNILENLKVQTFNIEKAETKSVKAGNLWHLQTLISAEIKNETSVNELVKTLHPTPAVCGEPTLLARDFIIDHENYNREFYTGYCGDFNIFSENSCHLFVNLRCCQLSDNKSIIYAGGGITKDSLPFDEWQEIYNKAQTIFNIF